MERRRGHQRHGVCDGLPVLYSCYTPHAIYMLMLIIGHWTCVVLRHVRGRSLARSLFVARGVMRRVVCLDGLWVVPDGNACWTVINVCLFVRTRARKCVCINPRWFQRSRSITERNLFECTDVCTYMYKHVCVFLCFSVRVERTVRRVDRLRCLWSIIMHTVCMPLRLRCDIDGHGCCGGIAINWLAKGRGWDGISVSEITGQMGCAVAVGGSMNWRAVMCFCGIHQCWPVNRLSQ